MTAATPPLTLHGFNNLAKSLGISLYTVNHVGDDGFNAYADDIDTRYAADKLSELLTAVTRVIGANVLNLACQNYEPQGASATVLVAEHETVLPHSVVGHLDKSHMAVHTYPETRPVDGVAIFRADVDVSTCGVISPLEALDYLIGRFAPDVVTIDYRIRGMTRNAAGEKCFADHDIGSIQDFLSTVTRRRFHMEDVNCRQANVFHTRMMARQAPTMEHAPTVLDAQARTAAQAALEREKLGLFQACETGEPRSL